ncbi:MAG: hypothetical protein QXF45_07595 [Candidatus Caldarchaeum sp.]
MPAAFINSTITYFLYMNLSYSFNEESYWEKVNSHGDPWVWHLGMREARHYRTALLSTMVSLEVVGLRAELRQKYETATRTIDSITSENQKLRNDLRNRDNKITSLENEKRKLESDLKTLENILYVLAAAMIVLVVTATTLFMRARKH